MRVYAVIDTNVIVSALLARNPQSATIKVLEAFWQGKIVPLVNDEIIDEYDEVLRRPKFRFHEELVAQHKQSFYSLCACSTSSMSHHQIAQLVRQIGCYVFMDYGAVGDTIKGGSGAYSEDVYDALDYLGYKSDVFQLYSFEKVLSSLSSQKLIYMRGQRPSGGRARMGHRWSSTNNNDSDRIYTSSRIPLLGYS